MNNARAAVSHHERLIEELRDDPTFAREYLATALAEADEPGGREALLLVLRQLISDERRLPARLIPPRRHDAPVPLGGAQRYHLMRCGMR